MMRCGSVEGVGRAPVRRTRVLIVDDEPMMGMTLRVALADEHDVVVVSSGDAAQRLLASDGHFDAIVCDLMMPGVSGMDLHRWVHDREPSLSERMIFMTGGAYTASAREFLARARNPHVQKPFDIDELLALVRSVREDRAPNDPP